MSQAFTNPKDFSTTEILAKLESYGVTTSTARKVVINVRAERVWKAADLSENALADFWCATLPAEFLAEQYTKSTPELYSALTWLGFRPEIIDRVRLRVHLDNNTLTLLEWGKMIASQARDLKCFPHLVANARIEAGLGMRQPVPLGERWKGVNSKNKWDGADII